MQPKKNLLTIALSITATFADFAMAKGIPPGSVLLTQHLPDFDPLLVAIVAVGTLFIVIAATVFAYKALKSVIKK